MVDILLATNGTFEVSYLLYTFVGALFGTVVFLINWSRDRKKEYVTGDGYVLRHQDMEAFSSVYKDYSQPKLYRNAPLLFLALLVCVGMMFYVPGMVASYLFGTSFLIIPHFLLILVALSCSSKLSKEEEERFKQIAKTIPLHPTGNFAESGRFVTEPELFLRKTKQLDNLIKALEDSEQEYLEKMAKKQAKLDQSKEEGDVSKIVKFEKKMKKLSKERLAKEKEVESLTEEIKALITNEIPETTAHILKQNPYVIFGDSHSPISNLMEKTTVLQESSPMPYAIDVMEGIARDERLPERLRSEARRSVEEYFQELEKKEEDELVNDAELRLQVAKQMLN